MLFQGFQEIFSDPMILLMCFVGVVIGTLIGALPGLGPSTAIAVLLPVIYGKDPLTSLVTLSGIYAGGMFGGMISSIALNMPGTSSAVVTTFDGYPMSKQGKAGKAMGIAAVSSFIGGTMGTILLTFMGVTLARWALNFGPPEYFAIYVFTFAAILSLGSENIMKSALSLFLGFLLASIGMDPITGGGRLTFGSVNLMSGVDFLPAIIGLFGLSEIVLTLSERKKGQKIETGNNKYNFRNVFVTFRELWFCFPSIIRGGLLGFFVGVLPGAGATIATFSTYSIEKKLSKDPDSFGKGNPRGVAGPEAANNGSAAGSYVPLLALGIPGSATAALLLGAFILVGIQPGPRLFTNYPDVAGGLIASMYVGNIMLLVINTAFIPIFIWLLHISQKTLPVIVASLCVIGSYALNNSLFDVFLMVIFTFIGIFYKKLKIPAAPTIIAIVLGGSLEFSLRQTLELFRGNFLLSFSRPICIFLYLISFTMISVAIIKGFNKYSRNR